MPKGWSRGQTKETNPSLLKISNTMKARGIDNFSAWRKEMKACGKIKSNYPDFQKSGDLAELLGVCLGDGHIYVFPRTESLSLFSNSEDVKFIKRYSALIEKIIGKRPTIKKRKTSNCTKINIYEKNLSRRLGIPAGGRRWAIIKVPEWILSNNEFVIRYLRGLYEAEGSLCKHEPTSTYKFLFRNYNTSMLENVRFLMEKLGFHPYISSQQVQISRKDEVHKAVELLQFRKY